MNETRDSERDAMRCRACDTMGRASEGYPCTSCGTFICLQCTLRGITQCPACRPPAASA